MAFEPDLGRCLREETDHQTVRNGPGFYPSRLFQEPTFEKALELLG
ncbi:MAG TPA: hypothetical protein VNP89_06540 [Gaiellaceae bacterium]|nr:hypothetical protein [Gaiellaceae bacterium]